MQETAFYLLYKLNEKSISEKYCVNKNKIGSCCHGKCHLTKVIAKAENNNSKNPFSVLNVKSREVEILYNQLLKIEIPVQTIPSIIYPTYQSDLLSGISFTLIKPPAVFG